MSTVFLRLFGQPQLDGTGGPELLPLNAPTSLLFYLAASGRWVSRQELAYLYRPDEAEDVAYGYLRLQLHRAQRYPWALSLEVTQEQLRWQVDSDVQEFRQAVAGRDWLKASQAVTGPFLANRELKDRSTYNSWLERERADFDNWLRVALLELAHEYSADGRHEETVIQYRRLLQLDELDEAANAGLVQALALAGEREQALRHYQKFADLLQQELAMEPAASTMILVESVRNGTLQAPQESRQSQPQLPQASTVFIGRKSELQQLDRLLADDDCNLLNIVGMGGSGKTRLALELARRHVDSYRDGCRFIALQDVGNLEQAVRRIGENLELTVDEGADGIELLLSQLADRRMLLVLDNCEQVPGLPALLSRLLVNCPGVMLVTTSRERLGLQGEWIFDLAGMKTLEQEPGETPDAQLLFESAVRRVAPRLRMTELDRQHAAAICTLVDGLPLALELAAAWVRLMPVDRIAEEIGNSFELLETDLEDLPERHRSLKSILQRTWNDLSDEQATALMRFSVFQGGASLAATEEVTGARLPLLLGLVNQSLLVRDDLGRFFSHPLLAQFSAGMLKRRPELHTAAGTEHTRHYSGLLRRVGGQHNSGSDELLKQLMPDIDNIERAWFDLVDSYQVGELLAVIEPLMTYYNVLGQYSQGLDLGRRTLAQLTHPTDAEGADLHCELLLACSSMLRESGDLDEALELAVGALELAERFGFATHQAKSLRYEGDVLQMLGRFDEAQLSYTASLDRYEELGQLGELANTLNSLASLEAVQEKFAEATARFERCVDLFEQTGDQLARAIALNNLGYLADAQGQVDTATLRYEESLAAFEQIRFTRGIAAVQNNLVVLYGMAGRYDQAEASGKASLELKEQMNDRMGKVVTLKNLGDIKLKRGDPKAAIGYYLPAIQLAHDTSALPRLLQVVPGFAQALDSTGDRRTAERLIEAMQRHPLTPPSARQRAGELWPHLPQDASADEELLEQALRRFIVVNVE